MNDGSRSESAEDMNRPDDSRLPGELMIDRIVCGADAAPEIHVRWAASFRVRKFLRVIEESIGVNHRMTVWGDRSR